jgi:hypothetical protein
MGSRRQEQNREDGKAQSGQYIASASCQLVIRVLGHQAQMWARVTMNKTMRTVRPKANNI